jgi:hypothetical protein
MPVPPPPPGYDEVGKPLATAVLSGYQDKQWALDYAKILGYSAKDLEAWLRWTKNHHRMKFWRAKKREQRLAKRARQAMKALEEAEAQARAKAPGLDRSPGGA